MAETSSTVIVACKLPNGLRLDLMGEEVRSTVPTLAGPQEAVHRNKLGSVVLRGSAAERRLERGDDYGRPMDAEPIATVSGGFGLTTVDKGFWEAWSEQNRDYPPFKNGLIFAGARSDHAPKRAAEQAELRSGYEPMDPEKPSTGRIKLEMMDRAA